ncbi:hypothetical protein GE300_21760 [Rhodobacteraceae bacterium 2CG4]|uniref:Lipoprotein n=1 Tax=Halovulum marinum TaxID=2662447 RepID=A0A6L5Z7T7_9RHOB|nr:hypothetical protein [Halovulum marinum]MSU92164.1 hypothetical protein [Halovulum marinum]
MRIGLAAALALAACAAETPADPGADYAQVIWKTGTPVAARAADLEACELAAIGAGAALPQDRITDAARTADPVQRRARLQACLRARGYAIAELRVCRAEDRAAGRLRRILATDALPPAATVRCYAPEIDGFIARQAWNPARPSYLKNTQRREQA